MSYEDKEGVINSTIRGAMNKCGSQQDPQQRQRSERIWVDVRKGEEDEDCRAALARAAGRALLQCCGAPTKWEIG